MPGSRAARNRTVEERTGGEEGMDGAVGRIRERGWLFVELCLINV